MNTEMNIEKEKTIWIKSFNLPHPLSNHGIITTKNKVYTLGGYNEKELISTIYTANINLDGTLSHWEVNYSLPDLPQPMGDISIIIDRSYAYIIGGFNEVESVASVYIINIVNEKLNKIRLGSYLPMYLSAIQAIKNKDKIYVIGGDSDSFISSSVFMATINTDGSLSNWKRVSNLPEPVAYGKAIVNNNKIYILGGYNHGNNNKDYNDYYYHDYEDINKHNYLSSIYTSIIREDGTLSEWKKESNIPNKLFNMEIININNKLLMLGGSNSIDNNTSNVYMANIPMEDNDLLFPWVRCPLLPEKLSKFQITSIKNKIHLIGGFNGVDRVSNVYTTSISSYL